MHKRILCPERLRRIPPHFNWIDHRLVSERHIDELSHQACALYLFLVTAADRYGLSYYGERTLQRRLSMDCSLLSDSFDELVRAELVCRDTPLCQVLSLEEDDSCTPVYKEYLP